MDILLFFLHKVINNVLILSKYSYSNVIKIITTKYIYTTQIDW